MANDVNLLNNKKFELMLTKRAKAYQFRFTQS